MTMNEGKNLMKFDLSGLKSKNEYLNHNLHKLKAKQFKLLKPKINTSNGGKVFNNAANLNLNNHFLPIATKLGIKNEEKVDLIEVKDGKSNFMEILKNPKIKLPLKMKKNT